MQCAPLLFAIAFLLSGCDRPLSVEALAADPSRLHTLRMQCRAGERDCAFCVQVAQADLRRFLSGNAGPGEYQTLADLPPIPTSFDEPADDNAPRQEDAP